MTTNYSAIIESAIKPVRDRHSVEGGAETIPCPICGGEFTIAVAPGGKVRAVCPPAGEGKPYCISYID